MAIVRHEGEDLLTLVRTWLHDATDWRPATPDRLSLWGHIRRHGLDGMAGALVARGTTIPEPMQKPALDAYCTISLRAQQAVALGREIRGAAQQAGIPLGFVKGPALISAYGDDGVRGFGDIDVLVPNADAACRLSTMCGLTFDHAPPGGGAAFWKHPQAVGRMEAQGRHFVVEFTTGVDPGSDAIYELCLNWPERYLLPAESGDPFPVPAPESHLLFLLQHLGLHWFNRLIWLVDFAVILRSGNVDTDWLESAATRLEMRKMLRAVTVFCRRNLDDSIRELGVGPIGWKDGLYLSLLSPETFTRQALFKEAHPAGRGIKVFVLGALQFFFESDLEWPSFSRRHAAPRWVTDWLQYYVRPGGKMVAKLSLPLAPFLFVCMTLLVCAVYRRSPRGFARGARQYLVDSDLRLLKNISKQGVAKAC